MSNNVTRRSNEELLGLTTKQFPQLGRSTETPYYKKQLEKVIILC